MVCQMATVEALENPILNSPYEPPARHFVLGPHGPTGEVRQGRRLSESFIPIPTGRRPRGPVQGEGQATLDSMRPGSGVRPTP